MNKQLFSFLKIFKAPIKNLFLLPLLIAGLGLMLAGRVTAQTFTTLYSFAWNTDGTEPKELILSGNTLYGTTSDGEISNNGTVFAVNFGIDLFPRQE